MIFSQIETWLLLSLNTIDPMKITAPIKTNVNGIDVSAIMPVINPITATYKLESILMPESAVALVLLFKWIL